MNASEPIFEFVLYGLIFIGAFVWTLCFWRLVSYVYDKVKR